MRCDECKFWRGYIYHSTTENRLGECHRFPPDTRKSGYYPVTSLLDWCGEFEEECGIVPPDPLPPKWEYYCTKCGNKWRDGGCKCKLCSNEEKPKAATYEVYVRVIDDAIAREREGCVEIADYVRKQVENGTVHFPNLQSVAAHIACMIRCRSEQNDVK